MANKITSTSTGERKTSTSRKLTKEEMDAYSGAVIAAANWVPAFRDSIALLRPFVDMTAETAYTDRYARVGLSPWFFYKLNDNQRASVILHETMHCLNNHFQRWETAGFFNGRSANIAGDFEINCGIDKLANSDLKFAVFPEQTPWNLERYKAMEYYYGEVQKHQDELKEQYCQCEDDHSDCDDHDKQDGGQDQGTQGAPSNQPGDGQDNASDDGNGSGGSNEGQPGGDQITNGMGDTGEGEGNCDCCGKPKFPKKMCDEATDQRSQAADDAGIERASDAEQTIARNNSMTRMIDELNNPSKSRGDGAMNDFLEYTKRFLTPPKVNWRNVLRSQIGRISEAIIKGRVDYSYRRTNRKTSSSEFIFPALVQYVPTTMFAFDTSGSMGKDDYMRILTEVESLLKAVTKGKNSLRVFSIDTSVKSVKQVKSVSDVKFEGGGGTDMSCGVAYINDMGKNDRPDIFVLATDGYTSWEPYEAQLRILKKKGVAHILLVTDEGGYKTVPDSLKKLCTVIDCS